MADLIDRETAIGVVNNLIARFERILRDIRESKGDDSVCGMCEYDGAYIGQSGNWCNECPGFDKDDCFKLSDETRKKWIEEIVNTYPDHTADIGKKVERDRILKEQFEHFDELGQNFDDSGIKNTQKLTSSGSGEGKHDLISRRAAIDALGEEPYVWTDDDDYARGARYQWKSDHDAIEALPSAQPERKRGKWKMDLKRHVFVCSICGAWQVFNCNYCSNCGTDMREVDE